MRSNVLFFLSFFLDYFLNRLGNLGSIFEMSLDQIHIICCLNSKRVLQQRN